MAEEIPENVHKGNSRISLDVINDHNVSLGFYRGNQVTRSDPEMTPEMTRMCDGSKSELTTSNTKPNP